MRAELGSIVTFIRITHRLHTTPLIAFHDNVIRVGADWAINFDLLIVLGVWRLWWWSW